MLLCICHINIPETPGVTLADVLFWLTVVSTIAMLALPPLRKTRGEAVVTYFSQLGGAVAFTLFRTQLFPSWDKPDWSNGLVWSLASWTFLVLGFIFAIRKPRKQRNTVA